MKGSRRCVTYQVSMEFSVPIGKKRDTRFRTRQTPFEKVCLVFRTVILSAMAGAIPFSEQSVVTLQQWHRISINTRRNARPSRTSSEATLVAVKRLC